MKLGYRLPAASIDGLSHVAEHRFRAQEWLPTLVESRLAGHARLQHSGYCLRKQMLQVGGVARSHLH